MFHPFGYILVPIPIAEVVTQSGKLTKQPSTFVHTCLIQGVLEILGEIVSFQKVSQWKRISCKQNARWQHLSGLKASAFFSLQNKYFIVKKCNNLYL